MGPAGSVSNRRPAAISPNAWSARIVPPAAFTDMTIDDLAIAHIIRFRTYFHCSDKASSPAPNGGSRALTADKPQSLSVIGVLACRVPADSAWLGGRFDRGDDCAQMDQLCAFVPGVRHGCVS